MQPMLLFGAFGWSLMLVFQKMFHCLSRFGIILGNWLLFGVKHMVFWRGFPLKICSRTGQLCSIDVFCFSLLLNIPLFAKEDALPSTLSLYFCSLHLNLNESSFVQNNNNRGQMVKLIRNFFDDD